jgi:hypothetical protein
LVTISPAAVPNYSRYSNLIAETLPTQVRRDFAEMRAAAAFIAITVRVARCAEIPGRQAGRSRVAGQPEAGERHRGKAEAEPFEGLPARYGLGYAFGQLIEFVVHLFSFLFFGVYPQAYDA